jgi:DNA-directed RNA polymerase specialized sigma subunit
VRAKDEATLSQQLGRRPSEEELDQFVRQDSTKARAESTSMTRRNHRTARNPYALSAAMEASRVLDVRDAAILHLYLVGDFSQQKIAELFGITQPRVSQILHAARAAYIPRATRSPPHAASVAAGRSHLTEHARRSGGRL